MGFQIVPVCDAHCFEQRMGLESHQIIARASRGHAITIYFSLVIVTRRQRSASPVVGYNFKVGDFYPSTTLKFYPSIFRSLSDVTRGVRRAS